MDVPGEGGGGASRLLLQPYDTVFVPLGSYREKIVNDGDQAFSISPSCKAFKSKAKV